MFKFCSVCELLQSLQEIARHDPPLAAKEQSDRVALKTLGWFKSYRKAIDSLESDETSALISSLLPHRRKDRIFGIQHATLLKILGRCLGLSASKRQDLARYRAPGNGDLADCFERVLHGGGPPALPPVSLLEVDDLLHYLAGQCRFSAPHAQNQADSSNVREERLKQVLLRLAPVEAKWLIRLILKDLSPAVLDDSVVLSGAHFLFPDVLAMHNDIEAASKVLASTFKGYPSRPDPQSRAILRQTAAASLKPIPGVMVTRSEFCKARSIQHCLKMAGGQRWVVERKYDGEYCQIHVDLRKGTDWLKIYSKSGRDSTKDRQGLHEAIRRCLRIGSSKCQIKRQCILVGEMVVYSDKDQCILSFDKIRKHVSRAGVFLGVDQDSPAQEGEHLMIILFDVLMLNDESLIHQSVDKRRDRLGRLYKKIDGRAMSAESTLLDFNHPNSARKLVHQFVASNVLRHEGLVLKPCDVPYLSLAPTIADSSRTLYPRMIKLKKDYIAGLGDEADFAVVGASYNAQEANKRPELRLSWTHFHLGCLMNEVDVGRHQKQPIFKVVATIAMDQCIPVAVLRQINAEGKFLAEQPPSAFNVQADESFKPDVFFRWPFVFEVLGSSYTRPSNAAYFMLRHPRVKKLHGDRTWRECITFDELQDAAQEALAEPTDPETQENLRWMEKLQVSCKRKFEQMSCNTTPESAASILTPRKHSQIRRSEGLESTRCHINDTRLSRVVRLDSPRFQGIATTRAQQKLFLPTPPTSSPSVNVSTHKSSCVQKHAVVSATSTYQDSRVDSSIVGPTKPNSAYSNPRSRRGTHPLADLMTCAPQSLKVATATRESGSAKGMRVVQIENEEPKGIKPHGTAIAEHASATVLPLVATSRSQTDATDGDQDPCMRQTVMPRSEAACFLHDAVVHVDSSVGNVSDRIQQSLQRHGVKIARDLQHWDRDSFAHSILSETVSESQSFPGLRKIALVDSEHPARLRSALTRILNLNRGQLCENVEVYDYRLAEVLFSSQTRCSSKGNCQLIRGRSVGVVTYDSQRSRSVFTPPGVGSSAEKTTGVCMTDTICTLKMRLFN